MNHKGLSDSQVLESRSKYGSNVMPEPESETFFQKVIANFADPMIKLLCAIAIIFLVFWGIDGFHGIPTDPIGTILSIFLVVIISASSEMASDKAFKKLKSKQKKDTSKVIRNGNVAVVPVDDLVVGDIVILQSGDKIFADGYLMDGALKVNNQTLNGESEECKKTATGEDFFETSRNTKVTGNSFVDEHSLFGGAVVYSGEGYMMVTKVGTETQMGKMAEAMSEEEVEGPLKVKLNIMAGQISKFGIIGAIAIFIIYVLRTLILAGGPVAYYASLDNSWLSVVKDILKIIEYAAVIVVCAVPEGLPLMIALVLKRNSSKMYEKNILVRKNIGIETAGSIKTMFSDKTGTITKGILEVVDFFDGGAKKHDINKEHGMLANYYQMSVCKNTSAMFDGNHNVVGGNMTDHALLNNIGEAIFNSLRDMKNCEIVESQAFNSANKFSQSYVGGNVNKTFYKGAPERILAKATKYIDESGEVKDLDVAAVNKKIDELASRAMRIIAFGYSVSNMQENIINDDIVLIGFVGIRDDVRQEAKESIEDVQRAGIQVVMITGDRLETAFAIAKEASLLTGAIDTITVEEVEKGMDYLKRKTEDANTIAISSDALNLLDDEFLKTIVHKIRLIARALPTDKSRMVKLCQEMNLVCGMTGDGANDSPALKKADVGFAMGSGTDIAKEASEIIITDDNFSSIKNAIWYGRTIYHNILKFVRFQLAINVSAVMVSAILPSIGIERPLTVPHLLFINIVMDSLGALLLGGEPAEKRYMLEKPRERDESIVSRPMFIQVLIMGTYMFLASILYFKLPAIREMFPEGDVGLAQFRTAYFACFMFMAIFNGFNVRTETLNIFEKLNENKSFVLVWLAMLGATVLLCSSGGFIGEMFSCTRFGMNGWILAIGFGLSVIVLDMIRKIITKIIAGRHKNSPITCA